MEKYIEEGHIVDVHHLDTYGYTAEIQVNVKKYRLKCFSNQLNKTKSFNRNENCRVKFYLETWPEVIKLRKEKRDMRASTKYKRTPNHYILYGKIIKIINQPDNKIYDSAIVNCNIYAVVRIPKDKFKVGDYIKAEGRLDVHKYIKSNEYKMLV